MDRAELIIRGPSPVWVDQTGIHETKEALIRHGCDLTENPQGVLF